MRTCNMEALRSGSISITVIGVENIAILCTDIGEDYVSYIVVVCESQDMRHTLI